MEIIQEVQETIINWVAIYGPAILTIISSISTALLVIFKVANALKEAKKDFASNNEVKELKKNVKDLSDHIVSADRENRELKALLKKELEAKTRIKED